MKKIIMAALAAACMLSVSAMSIGFRGDVDFGMANITKSEEGKTAPSIEKAEAVTSGSAGLWVDMPIINLGIISLGFRPEAEIAIGEGFAVKTEDAGYVLSSTSLTIPVFLDVCANLSVLRVSAGVGPYVTMPLSFKQSNTTILGQNIQKPNAGWESHEWGLAGYLQAGVKLGAGYLLGDARVSAPFGTKELKSVVLGTEDGKTLITAKTYKLGVGLGYEFKF